MSQMPAEIELEQIISLDVDVISRNTELLREDHRHIHNDINTKEWVYFTANGKKWRAGSDPDGDNFLFQYLASGDWRIQSNWVTARTTQPLGGSYGSLYLHEGAANVDISTAGQGVYVKITGLTTGLCKNVVKNSDAFNVTYPGIFKTDWAISGDSAGQNKDYEVDIFIDGAEQADGSARRLYGAAGSLGSISGTAILDVTDATHDIDLRMKEIGAGAGTDFDIFNLNFNIFRIGET